MGDTGGVLDRSAVLAAVPDVPPPGAGATWQRFAALVDTGRADLARAKLVESHLDALAILDELAPRTAPADCLWAVWAAEPPTARLRADGPRLTGTKAFCSGAAVVDRALVTVPDDDGSRLFAVDVAAGRADGTVVVGPDEWVAGGMARSGTRTLTLTDVPATAVGGPGDYTARPGFWHGAAGVAACWHGGTLAVADLLLASSRRRADDPLVRRRVAEVAAEVAATDAVLRRASEQVDHEVRTDAAAARLVAELTRTRAVTAARRVLEVARTALGPGPLAFDPAARDVTEDLAMFVLQHHGDRDLAALGGLVLDAEHPW
ncbi:acyl-CoA dehydrogenase family protein [Solicola sp. PLA-1-18]|uniref:acyl-CoA dehydrogenase family protein n=1 Tax=Solicola sp. PLA-1-18 TaxID=3380532 RepID=UPI003B8283CC